MCNVSFAKCFLSSDSSAPMMHLARPSLNKAAERHGPPCTKQGMWKQWGKMFSVFLFLHINLRHVMCFPSCSLTPSPWSNSHVVISYFQSPKSHFLHVFMRGDICRSSVGELRAGLTLSLPQNDLTSYLFRNIPHPERVHVLCIRWNKRGCCQL